VQNEHNKNISAQLNRIDHIGAMNERKKNVNDAMAHPILKFVVKENKPNKYEDYLIQQFKPRRRVI